MGTDGATSSGGATRRTSFVAAALVPLAALVVIAVGADGGTDRPSAVAGTSHVHPASSLAVHDAVSGLDVTTQDEHDDDAATWPMPIIAGPLAQTGNYATPVAYMPQGVEIDFLNLDLDRHDVRSVDGRFQSALIEFGETAPVEGTAQLEPGTYAFTCSIHPGMSGQLVVEDMDEAEPVEPSFDQPLRIPPVHTDQDITLEAYAAEIQVFEEGPATWMWTFDGEFPGPTIRRPSGEPTNLTIHYQDTPHPDDGEPLPSETGTLTVHNHGAHVRPEDDGQPGPLAFGPGESFTYTYPHVEHGQPERASFQWYHDHSHHRVSRNIWMGLAGMYILDDEFEDALPLPDGDHDIPLMIVDRSFNEQNQLTRPMRTPDRHHDPIQQAAGPGHPPFDETVGSEILVNGVPTPHLEVEPRRYRLRLLNAANFQPYNLRIEGGPDLVQIGTDAGLLPAPVTMETVMIGPAERAEVVVDFSGYEGEELVLESVLRETGGRATEAPNAPIMQFRVGDGPVEDDSTVPDELRPLPDWVDEASEVPDRVWSFELAVDDDTRPAWTINGRAFEMDRVDARPEMGSVETWMLVNSSPVAVSHAIHMHGFDFTILSRNGQAPEPHERALKETFWIDPGEVLVVAAEFPDFTGRYMLHCHMLDHEDNGMMTFFEIVGEGEGDLAAPGGDGPDGAPDDDTPRTGGGIATALLAFLGAAVLVRLGRRGVGRGDLREAWG